MPLQTHILTLKADWYESYDHTRKVSSTELYRCTVITLISDYLKSLNNKIQNFGVWQIELGGLSSRVKLRQFFCLTFLTTEKPS